MIISIYSKSCLESPKIISRVMKNQTQNKVKMDPEKAPAPVKKLIEAAKDDLMERRCIEQYIEESSDGTFDGEQYIEESSDGTSNDPGEPLSPMDETQPGEWEVLDDKSVKYGKVAGSWVAIPEH